MVGVSLCVSLACAEVVTRIVYPVSDGRENVTLDGQPIKSFFPPGSVYRQVSNEYDAMTTITVKGHRVPEPVGNPDIIFLGDSFTYGWGIRDDETFASIYCAEMQRSCANLGVPGTGTAKQLDRLEQFLQKYDWRPAEVKLFFFGMSGSWSAGNDFVDAYDERGLTMPRTGQERSDEQPQPSPERRVGLAERVIGLQTALLGRSNLMRVAKYRWGPIMKSLMVADPGEARFAEALKYARMNLEQFDALSKRRSFAYTIYLLVPVQDILRSSASNTLARLNEVSPKPVVETAWLFRESPQSYFFAYDGHLNPKGSRRIAELLVSRDRSAKGSTVTAR